MKRGTFIVIDGMDGSGKTTEMKFLKKEFPHAVFTYEPGGTPRSEKIRRALLTHDAGKRDAVADFFLFWASRATLMQDLVAPALKKGKMVITDRFDSSTYAFQVSAEARKDLEPVFWTCREAIVDGNAPDAYIFLDITPEIALRRRRIDKSKTMTGFDKQKLAYHKRVREGFKKFKPGVKVYVVDADRTPEEVHKDVCHAIRRVFGIGKQVGSPHNVSGPSLI
jgi:dTMP kinase